MRHPQDEGGEDRADQLRRDRPEGVESEPPHHPQVFSRAPLRPRQESRKNLWN